MPAFLYFNILICKLEMMMVKKCLFGLLGGLVQAIMQGVKTLPDSWRTPAVPVRFCASGCDGSGAGRLCWSLVLHAPF